MEKITSFCAVCGERNIRTRDADKQYHEVCPDGCSISWWGKIWRLLF